MKRCLLAGIFFMAAIAPAESKRKIVSKLKNGDIIFQKLACGELCKAILEVTPCAPDGAFNHCGIIHKTDKETFVIEAIGARVHETRLDSFLLRAPSKDITIGRLVSNAAKIGDSAVQRALEYIGRPYDDAFLPGDSALYCSELVWEAYRTPHTGAMLFELRPMTFRSPSAKATFPAWQRYYDDLHMPVPEGVPGINPCAIANSPLIQIIRFVR